MACRACGLHRPGLNSEGVCLSCISFGKTVPPQEVDKTLQVRFIGKGIADVVRQLRSQDTTNSSAGAEHQRKMEQSSCPACGKRSGVDTYFLCDQCFETAAKCLQDAGVKELGDIASSLKRMVTPPAWADSEQVYKALNSAAFKVAFSGGFTEPPGAAAKRSKARERNAQGFQRNPTSYGSGLLYGTGHRYGASLRAQAPTEGRAPSRSRGVLFCKQCDGDGGATGNCPRCGGNGFEP